MYLACAVCLHNLYVPTVHSNVVRRLEHHAHSTARASSVPRHLFFERISEMRLCAKISKHFNISQHVVSVDVVDVLSGTWKTFHSTRSRGILLLIFLYI